MIEQTLLETQRGKYHRYKPPVVVYDPDYLRKRNADLFWAAEQMEPHRYRFAKTMADIPHSYTLQREWDDQSAYDRVVRYAGQYGEKTWFRGYYYRELRVNGYTYWAIGYVLNRRRMFYTSPYSDVASRYYAEYNGIHPRFAEENQLVKQAIGEIKPSDSLLDIGSGTGRFLKLFPEVASQQYTGLEPSMMMAMEFAAAHPDYHRRLVHCTLDDYFPWDKQFDVIVALFGSGEAVTDIFKLRRMLKPGGRAVIMRYSASGPAFWKQYDLAEPRAKLYPELREALGSGQPVGEYSLHVIE